MNKKNRRWEKYQARKQGFDVKIPKETVVQAPMRVEGAWL
jgi:hypothetical protein